MHEKGPPRRSLILESFLIAFSYFFGFLTGAAGTAAGAALTFSTTFFFFNVFLGFLSPM